MSCPQEPLPTGWQIWRGPVPAPLVQLAMHIRDNVHSYQRGTVAQVTSYNGQQVAAFVSSHTWTYKNGQLVTGICIPGVSLLVKQGSTVGVGANVAPAAGVPVAPDPTLAVYGAPGPPPVNWGLVTAGGAAAVALGALIAVLLTRAGGR